MATTRAQEEERIRHEQGQQFLKQLNDMFQQTRQDMSQQFVPRPEFSAHMEKMDQVLEGLEKTVERIGGNVSSFHENAPARFADKAETKSEMGELRTEIEKLKTARESDMQRGYGWRFEDEQGRYRSALASEQGLRSERREQTNISMERIITVGIAVAMIAANIVLAIRH